VAGRCGLARISCGIPRLDSRASVLGFLCRAQHRLRLPEQRELSPTAFTTLPVVATGITVVSPLPLWSGTAWAERPGSFAVNPAALRLLSTGDQQLTN
jgi:hypothetical protein